MRQPSLVYSVEPLLEALCTLTITCGFFWCLGLPLPETLIPGVLFAALGTIRKDPFSAVPATRLIFAYAVLYAAANLIHQLRLLYLGGQSVDLAIFSQNIYQFATTGSLQTSLLGTRYLPFLGHHFSPIWYLPAIFLKFGGGIFGSAAETLLLFHAILIGITLLLVRELLQQFGLAGKTLTAFLIIISLHPTLRTALFWETREDVFFLPLLLLWMLALHKRKYLLATVFALSGCLFQEKIALISSVMGVVNIIAYLKREKVNFATLGLLTAFSLSGILFFYLYDRHPHLFKLVRSFETSGRILSVDQFFSSGHLHSFRFYLQYVLLPSSFLCLLSPASILLSLPAFALLGMNAVSNMASMLNPDEYYSIIAVLIMSVSGAYGFAKLRAGGKCLTLAIAFYFSVTNQPDQYPKLYGWSSIPTVQAIVSLIPQDAVVITDDYSAALLYETKRPMRLFHANRNIVHFDYVLTSANSNDPISAQIAATTKICAANAALVLRCLR